MMTQGYVRNANLWMKMAAEGNMEKNHDDIYMKLDAKLSAIKNQLLVPDRYTMNKEIMSKAYEWKTGRYEKWKVKQEMTEQPRIMTAVRWWAKIRKPVPNKL